MNRSLAVSSLLLLFIILFPEISHSQNLVLTPNRIVFEGKKRKDQVLVNNPSNEEQTYRVTFENKKMLDDGRYAKIEDGEKYGDNLYSKDIIRFSPRTFTLAPKTSQTVRLQLRKKKGMKEGEYRSHMKVAVVPKAQAPKVKTTDSVNIKIQVHYGITIPVIVRNGDLSYSAKISEASMVEKEDGVKALKARIDRSGKSSVYGDISVTHFDKSGQSTVLKFLPGISVFTPNKFRIFDINLEVPEELDLTSGKIEIKYVDRATKKIAAQKTIDL